MWPLYLLLLAVELHGGIGLYRLAVKWGRFEGADPASTGVGCKLLKWPLTVFFLVLGFATLAAYIKIGIEHQDRYGERYVPTLQAHPGHAGGRSPMNFIYTDVLVIGGGLAGLRMGIGAKRRGHDVIIFSLVPAKRSHSAAAQGGMQASLGNVIKGQGDNEDVHFEDTVRGSDWGADQKVVRMFVNTRPRRCASLRPGACRGAGSTRATGRSSSMARRSRSPSGTRRTAWSRSATSAAPRSGAPATSPTAPATRCSTRWATRRSRMRFPVHERRKRWP